MNIKTAVKPTTQKIRTVAPGSVVRLQLGDKDSRECLFLVTDETVGRTLKELISTSSAEPHDDDLDWSRDAITCTNLATGIVLRADPNEDVIVQPNFEVQLTREIA